MNIIIVIALAGVIVCALYMTIKKARKGGGCCGDKAAPVASSRAGRVSRRDYPHTITLRISGMTCANCARRVENALNSLPGVAAKVSLDTGKATIRTQTPPDVAALRAAVSRAGYRAEAVI